MPYLSRHHRSRRRVLHGAHLPIRPHSKQFQINEILGPHLKPARGISNVALRARGAERAARTLLRSKNLRLGCAGQLYSESLKDRQIQTRCGAPGRHQVARAPGLWSEMALLHRLGDHRHPAVSRRYQNTVTLQTANCQCKLQT